MSKRMVLGAVKTAAEVKNRGVADVVVRKTASELVTLRLPKQTYDLLRSVAVTRAAAGLRFSLSAVVRDLAERHRDELQKEAQPKG